VSASSRGRLPGPIRRLARERSRLVAVLLLAVVALAAAGIQSSAAATLAATLDANWRGAYDILVTAKGDESDVEGLLAPNSLGSSALSFTELDSIRSVAGVDIAAPIGEMIAPALKHGSASITIPRGFVAGADDEPQAFRVTVTYSTDDGLGERYVAESTTSLIVDETPVSDRPTAPEPEFDGIDAPCTFNSFAITEQDYPELYESLCSGIRSEPAPVTATENGSTTSTFFTVSNNAFVVNVGTPPQSVTRVTLVDPVAEAALLGEAGAFLVPLETIAPTDTTDVTTLTSWARATDSAYAADFLEQEKLRSAQAAGFESEEVFAQVRQLYADNGADYDEAVQAQQSAYVPLLVADTDAAALSATVTIEPFGAVDYAELDASGVTFPYELSDDLRTGKGGGQAESSTADVAALLNPFINSDPTVPWPGSTPTELDRSDVYNSLMVQNAGVILGSPYLDVDVTTSGASANLDPVGYRNPIPNYANGMPDLLAADADPLTPGAESVYAGANGLPTMESALLAVPVGSFSTEEITALQPSLSYVPLGAYQPVSSTLANGTVMQPSVSGLGLVAPRTVAIASIYSAAAWNQKAPISAVRVRVAGIDAYSADARARVIEVASDIRDLGFTATIVAGSSPTDVAVQVNGYATGVDSATGEQTVESLGAVNQQWSELGAAARADLAISTASASALGIALGSTALLLGAVQFVSVPRRRAQASVMREVGFTRSRIGRWMAAEEIPGLVVVIAAGVAAALLSGVTVLSLTISAIGIAVVIVTSSIAVALGSRGAGRTRSAPHRTTLRVRGRSIMRFGARQSRIHLLTTMTHLLAILVVALSAAALTSVFLQGQTAAGNSLLAQFTIGQSVLPQLVLGLTGVVAGVILSVIGRRVDLARRSQQWAVMRTMGWGVRDIRSAQRAESITIVVPAVVLAGAIGWWGSSALSVADPAVVTAATAIAAALASTVVLFVGRKATSL